MLTKEDYDVLVEHLGATGEKVASLLGYQEQEPELPVKQEDPELPSEVKDVTREVY